MAQPPQPRHSPDRKGPTPGPEVRGHGLGRDQTENYANVNADSLGKVAEILVEEGDTVKQGQVILRLESIQPAAEVDAQKAFLRTVQAEAKGAQASLGAAKAFLDSARGRPGPGPGEPEPLSRGV